ncbi:MAG: ABC transporter substrate-binding protein [Clostridia bacterium]|nr:ABC transporter substrate-binding protein [Clostridia bacterium]
MKKILALILVLALSAMCLIACGGAKDNNKDDNGDATKDTYTVGICQLVPHPALDAATQGFIDALKAELGDKVTFLNENANNDPAVCTTIVTNFVNKKVDLIMANATPALTAAVNGTTTIPVLGTSITEYGVALGIEDFGGTVGGNVSGTSDLAPLDQQAAMITDLFPEAKTVAMLYCSSEANSAYQVKVVKEALEAKGITVLDKSFTDSNDVNAVAANAAAEADVIYIPTDNTAAECAPAINGVIGDTPVIAGEQGICAGCGVATLSIEYYDLGFATGKMAAQILTGAADISTMPVQYAAQFTKMYNAEKCAQLNIDTAALEAAGYVAIAAE